MKNIFLSMLLSVLALSSLMGMEKPKHVIMEEPKHVRSRHALIKAAAQGKQDRVKRYLAEGSFDINKKDKEGDTALIAAANNGHETIVKMLLEAGAGPNIKSDTGYTALHRAEIYNHLGIVELLLQYGANPDIFDPLGQTARMDANRRGRTKIIALFDTYKKKKLE